MTLSRSPKLTHTCTTSLSFALFYWLLQDLIFLWIQRNSLEWINKLKEYLPIVPPKSLPSCSPLIFKYFHILNFHTLSDHDLTVIYSGLTDTTPFMQFLPCDTVGADRRATRLERSFLSPTPTFKRFRPRRTRIFCLDVGYVQVQHTGWLACPPISLDRVDTPVCSCHTSVAMIWVLLTDLILEPLQYTVLSSCSLLPWRIRI